MWNEFLPFSFGKYEEIKSGEPLLVDDLAIRICWTPMHDVASFSGDAHTALGDICHSLSWSMISVPQRIPSFLGNRHWRCCRAKTKNKIGNMLSVSILPSVVAEAGLEHATSRLWAWRATNCSTPRCYFSFASAKVLLLFGLSKFWADFFQIIPINDEFLT